MNATDLPADESGPAITMTRVVKRYGATVALAGLDLQVRRGEMFGLIGPDGAGKTTAIRLMCGLLHADQGDVRVLGLDPVRSHRRLTERVGYLSQRFSLYGDLTIDENISFFAEVHGVRDYQRRRDQLLSMTQLTPFRGRLADRLSGGMKQKLALACTLVHEPELILLDEPTTGVDPVSRREFWKLLSEFLADGITILMSTPYLDEAERCTRVALVHEGRVLAADEPARLRGLIPGRMLEVIAPGGVAADIIRRLPGVVDAQLFGERVHVTLDADSDEIEERFKAALSATPLAGVPVRQVQPSLEDVFIAQLSGAPPSPLRGFGEASREKVSG
ncbi:MAG TPA: ABC transporter ATP-binding protein [Vicinamibacterales bacterium]|nr:ABC transporter ATP-binding protein [Vicinamibacterales bacterium]